MDNNQPIPVNEIPENPVQLNESIPTPEVPEQLPVQPATIPAAEAMAYSNGEQTPVAETKPVQKKKKKIARAIIIPLLVLLLAGCAYAGYVFFTQYYVQSLSVENETVDFEITFDELNPGAKLYYKITPRTATKAKVLWSSSDEIIAKVDQAGNVTAISQGSCNVSLKVGNKSATYQINVKDLTVVEKIKMSKSLVTLYVGEYAGDTSKVSLSCTITPSTASKAKVTWTSSNEGIATVSSNGKVTANAVGSCTIRATTSNGIYSECSVTVKEALPDLKAVYKEYCKSSWATVALDGSYLEIDTNPNNIDDYTNWIAYFAIEDVNKALGLPNSLLEKMNATRALDGRQSARYDHLEVSWIYHPDHGLEILYEVIK